jgi:thiol-disulfide isomerase/thioredoxin
MIKSLPVIIFLLIISVTVHAQEPKPVEVYSNDSLTVKGYKWEGLKHFLSQQNDTIYVVNFWATWCVPCVEELPNFEKITQKYKIDKIKVILVSLDFGKDINTRLLPFIARKKIKSKVIVMREPDANSWIPNVDESWSGALPATVIYKGAQRAFFEKTFTFEELENEIKKFQ